MEPGTNVIIHQKPQHPRVVDIVGIVTGFRPGKGFGGADLVDVCYRHPRTGKQHTMPLNSSCMDSASPEALNKLVKHYEALFWDCISC